MCSCGTATASNMLALRGAFFEMVVDPVGLYYANSDVKRLWKSDPKLYVRWCARVLVLCCVMVSRWLFWGFVASLFHANAAVYL